MFNIKINFYKSQLRELKDCDSTDKTSKSIYSLYFSIILYKKKSFILGCILVKEISHDD